MRDGGAGRVVVVVVVLEAILLVVFGEGGSAFNRSKRDAKQDDSRTTTLENGIS